ncbi:hypothetical protein FSP39_016605 [Pinctada imbricata]|uniref:SPOC domain-containing protein n=1 Tax=Pinctada imbricata TaxID=66713 RepID=A0AA89CC77_PINIB|nr:hypothetical protein FSP39_016605 [Pinctada imbricata]
MAGLKSPHRDLMKHGPSLQSPLPGVHEVMNFNDFTGNIESAAHKAMIEESNRMMAPPTVGSSPIQTQASPIVTLANKFDSHFNHVMGARFPPPMSAHAANTTVVMTTSNSPLVSTGMSSAAQQEMVLNMSKHAPSSVAMTTAAPVSEAATVLSTAGNARSVISSSHSHVPPSPANDKFQQPEPVTTTSSSAIGEKRSNSLDRVQQSVTSAPTCVVHPITTTSLTSKQQQDAQAAQMMQLRMAEPRLNQIQALFHGDPKALEGLGKEQLCALMERGIPPFMHPMTDQHIIQHMANQKALFEMQKHQESVVKHPKGRNQKNPDPVKESQRPPSAHSNPKQGERLLLDQFNFPPMAFQEQIRAHYSKGPYGPQMWAHLQHLQNLKQLEEKNKMHAAVDPKTTSPSMLHQPSSVIAATVASQHGQHPQIKSPALAQTAPSPHQVGPTFTQAHSLQRPPSPQTGKKGSDKVPHNNRWPEANIIPAHEGQRSRPPSHDAERASPRDHWVYVEDVTKLTFVLQHMDRHRSQHTSTKTPVPMSQKERLMQRQKEEQHQREMQIQQEMQREKEKKHQELQWQLEERARQEAAAPAHSQGRRESNASTLPNQPTDLRQTALVPGQQRVPGQADEKMVDPRFGQHPGMGFPADLRRPSSQNPGGFPQPVSAAELSPGVNAHLTPEMQRRYQERVLAMGHHMQIDPLHMQQLLAQGLRPHFLPGGGIQVDHPALSEGRPPSQSSHRGENSQGHGPANQITSDGPMMHMHEAPMHGIPPRPPVHDGPPGGEGSLLSSLQRYPVMWQGVLALKNDQCVVQLHLINGFNQLVKMSLPQTSPDGTVQPLRIAQRMRLEAAQLEGVVKRMQFDKDYCMLLALPCGRNHEDIISQTRAMASGFIQYLQQKQAAGIVNVPEPESLQPAYVVHIFPPCEFSHNTLGRLGFDLLHQVRDLAHLLVIITTVA